MPWGCGSDCSESQGRRSGWTSALLANCSSQPQARGYNQGTTVNREFPTSLQAAETINLRMEVSIAHLGASKAFPLPDSGLDSLVVLVGGTFTSSEGRRPQVMLPLQ